MRAREIAGTPLSASVRTGFARIGPVYYALLALIVFAVVTQPAFSSGAAMRNVLVSSTTLAIITVGQTAVMLVGGIDLSIGPVMSLVTAVAAVQMQSNPELALPIVFLCLGIGLVVGLVNGFAVSYLGLNPLILTLATATAVQGIALAILYSPGGLVTRGFRDISRGSLGPIPYGVIYILVLYLIASYMLRRTRYGLNVYAVGGNETSARLSGLRVKRIKLTQYVFSGFLAATGGLYLVSRIGSGDPLVGEPFTLDSIAAAVLGGTSLFGGVGDVWGGLAGVLIIGILSTLLNLNNVSSFYQFIIKGVILIGALAVNFLRTRGRK